MFLRNGENCCGCGACSCICPKDAIQMKLNMKGFYEPDIDISLCVECGLCNKVCPFEKEKMEKQSLEECFAAQRKDKELLRESRSGGAFSVFAESILIDKGIVYGVATINREVKYIRIDSIAELHKLKGSKYVQASTYKIFNKVLLDLENNNTVLFSGTPCFVHALKSFLCMFRISLEKLFTIDLICHGVPSPKMYNDYLLFYDDMLQTEITDIDFRDKSFGWDSHVVTLSNKRIKYADYNFPVLYYSHLALRDCCYVCPYTSLHRVSDITIGDCWGIDKITNIFHDDGCSLIIINTENGRKLLNKTKNVFLIISVNIEDVLQPNLQHPTKKPDLTAIFWSDYNKYGFEYAVTRYCDFRSYYGNLLYFKEPLYKRALLKVKKKLWSDYYGK